MTVPAAEAKQDQDMADRVRQAGGNPWAAIRELLAANERLEEALRGVERENAYLRQRVSPGYARLQAVTRH